jgi:sugar phosphate isomerase/epimerase
LIARPLLSMCSWVSKSFEDVLRLALASGFEAVEMDCDEKPMPATLKGRTKLKEIIGQYGLRIFFHSPFLDQAIGSTDELIRQNSFNTLKMYLNFMEELEAEYLVVHVGADEEECLRENVIDDLRSLVNLAQRKTVTLCVENLRMGLTADPGNLLKLADECGTRICFDLGHASSCPWVKSQGKSPKEFLRIVESKVAAAHLYLKEEGGRHHPFTRIEEIKDTLDYLYSLDGVKWWTIELPSLEDTLKEKLVLDPYLKNKF